MGGFIALAAMRRSRLIGGVGFQQQLFQRDVGHQFAQAIGAFKCHWSADAEQEPQLVQLRGLFRATGETVDDAAQSADAVNRGNHRIHGASCMHDDRQVKLARQFELCVEIKQLRVGIQSTHEKIQPAFAHCHRGFAFNPVA